MNAVEIQRVCTGNDGTFGVLLYEGKPLCVTLENVWRNNERRVSCIPRGIYTAEEFSGQKYKDVWEIKGVKNRSAILIHWGNLETDTDGCVLVGKYFADFNGKQGIAESAKTVNMLRKILPEKFDVIVTGVV